MRKLILLIFTLSLSMLVPFNVFADGDGNIGYEMFQIEEGEKRYAQNVAENGSGNGWKWDAATKTLTLCGITDGNFYPYHVSDKTGLITIVLEDGTVNRISGRFMLNGCNYIIKGNGELLIEQAIGVLYDENGNYLYDENGYGVEGPVPNLMDWNTTVTIESGTITGLDRGIHIQGRLIMNGGTLKLGCGIFGGIQSDVHKVVFNGGKIITALPAITNLDKYTSAKSVVSFYRQDPDAIMQSGLEPCNATDENGNALIWKQEEDAEGFLHLNLYDQNGNYATYAEFTPADCYTRTGEKISDWAKESYYKAYENDIIPKDTDYKFVSDTFNGADLTKNISRGQFTAVVVNLYEKLSGQSLEKGIMPFSDVRYIYEDYVAKAYNAGLIYGMSDTEFSSDSFLTREQAAVILSRVYAKLVGEVSPSDNSKFTDDSDISDWARDAVYFMAKKGILQGMGENMFAPKANTQIQQAIAIAVRIMENIK
ncbi:MAG: S-layer homology domain-containing protein [Clostridia bacterium]|nr:S-layer homology domain-containing protein [Clostridia bacterium]